MPRRKRSPHPGIVRLPARPEKRQGESIRYKDPDTRRVKTEKIPDLPNEPAVRTWLAKRSEALQLRRVALKAGAAPALGGALADTIASFFTEATIRPSTKKMYEFTTGPFLRWASSADVKSGDDLNLAALRAFRAWTLARHRGGSPHTVNRDLRTMAGILEHSRKAGRCAHLTRDAIADGLERVPARVDRRPFLAPPEIRALVTLALATEPDVARWILFALLTGMRRIETLGIEWRDLSLDAGEIYVRPEITKPGCARGVDLAVCPGLKKALTGPDLDPRITENSPDRSACPALPGVRSKSAPLFALTPDQIREAQRRLIAAGAPRWTPNMLRRTCGTYLTCAPSIFGAASAFMSARQLGHSVTIAEKHYVGRVKIPADVRTLEAAMGIADLI